ncbi:MAG: hypothetical protein ABIJ00_08215 [Candidatus Eisenbacteria bacterium]
MEARILDQLLDEFAPSATGSPDAGAYLLGDPGLDVDRFFVAWNPGQLEGIIEKSTDGKGAYVAYLGGLDEKLRCLFSLSLKGLKGFVIKFAGPSWRYHSWGVASKIAKDLGIEDPEPVLVAGRECNLKVVTYAPEKDIPKVRESLFSAGAGRYGLYSKCSFSGSGKGTFLGDKTSNPAYGRPGQMEEIAEERLEVLVPSDRVGKAVAALRKVHPYEQPVIETYEVGSGREFGEGRMGRLVSPLASMEASRKIASLLGSRAVHVSGESKARTAMIWDGDPETGLYEALMRDIELYVGPDSQGLARLLGRTQRAGAVEFPQYCFVMAGAKELIYMVREKSKSESWGLRTFLPSKVGKEGAHK